MAFRVLLLNAETAFNLRRLLIALVSWSALLLTTTRASALPYELVARFELVKEGGAKQAVAVPISSDTPLVLPLEALNGKFVGIFIEPPDDDLSKSQLQGYDRIHVQVRDTGLMSRGTEAAPIADVKVDPEKLLKGETPTIIAPQRLAGRAAFPLEFKVYLHITQERMCEEEFRLRHEERKKKPTAEEVPTKSVLKKLAGGKKDPYPEAVLYSLPLRENGVLIEYSFCPGVNEVLDYKERAGSEAAADAMRANLKERLMRLVLTGLNRGDRVTGPAQAVKLAGDQLPHGYDVMNHGVAVVVDTSQLDLFETDNYGLRPLPRVIDHKSRLSVGLTSGATLCEWIPNCKFAIANRLTAKLTYTNGDKSSTEEAKLESQGRHWAINASLADHIGDRMTVVLLHRVRDFDLELIRGEASIENLGLITTFPVVTDVISAIQETPRSVRDIGAQSSVPVSWAIDLANGEAKNGAITFPWMIGFNPRGAPRLANYFRVYPHVSAIIPIAVDENDSEDDVTPTPKIATGAGVSLASIFTFSFGITLNDSPAHTYFLAGISAPDLAKLAW